MTPARADAADVVAPDVDALYADLWTSLPEVCARVEAELESRVGPGWTVRVDPEERRHPVVDVVGPADDDARRLIAHLTPVRCRAATFHATVGVSMRAGDLDLPARPEAAPAPGWIPRVRALGEAAERFAAERGGAVRISRRPGGGTLGPAAAKLALADRHGLPRRYAKGWPDRFLGVRTEPVAGADVPAFLAELGELLAAVAEAPAAVVDLPAGGGRTAP